MAIRRGVSFKATGTPRQRHGRKVLSRRAWFRRMTAGSLGLAWAGWMGELARAMAAERKQRHCILLWMTGGPSQLDTFDPKPEHENGGEFKPIETSVPGLWISEHLPRLARLADQLAVIRSLSTKEGDHGRGTYLMRTGHQPGGPIHYPTLGSLISKELGDESAELPNYVSIGAYRAFNRAAFQPGFLGPAYAPLTVGATDVFQAMQGQPTEDGYAELGVDDLEPPDSVTAEQSAGRLRLLESLQREFVSRHATSAPIAHATVYERAIRMMHSRAAKAFDLSEEPDSVREAYGRGRFGQGCLMARRLIEQGVPFVDVSLGRFGGGALGWDTHRNNFSVVKELSAELDAGWSALLTDLKDRGLLESTTIIWMGEFGRTPKINRAGGRDHYPRAWTAVLAGGGIRGGQAYGATSKDGTTVVDGRVDVGDLLATLAKAVGVDPEKRNLSDLGRPIRIAEGRVIESLVR